MWSQDNQLANTLGENPSDYLSKFVDAKKLASSVDYAAGQLRGKALPLHRRGRKRACGGGACGEVAGRRSGRGKAETREHRGGDISSNACMQLGYR